MASARRRHVFRQPCGWLSKLWSPFGSPKYLVPCYSKDPKGDHSFDNFPCFFDKGSQSWDWLGEDHKCGSSLRPGTVPEISWNIQESDRQALTEGSLHKTQIVAQTLRYATCPLPKPSESSSCLSQSVDVDATAHGTWPKQLFLKWPQSN